MIHATIVHFSIKGGFAMAKEYFVISQWATLIEKLNDSPMKFYELVETAIKERQISDISISQTEMKEAGLFSAKRVYITVERKKNTYDICAAPFGTGFFISTWLSSSLNLCQRVMLGISQSPLIGGFVAPSTGDVTFYQQDTTQMFQTSVHNAVLSAVDQLTKTKGLKALSESERKPVMSEFRSEEHTSE